jgi:hypothetical protein
MVERNKLQEWSDSLRDQRVVDQFAQANDMVPRKHSLSKDVLEYYSILSDIERLLKQPVSVKRDTLVDALNKELETPVDTVYSVIDCALTTEKALKLQVSKLNDELEALSKQYKSLNCNYIMVLNKAAGEEDEALRFIYSSRLLTFLFSKWRSTKDKSD